MSKTFIPKTKCFDHWRDRIWNLPFALTQGGEQVEPFCASKPGPRPKSGDSEGEFGISKLFLATELFTLSKFLLYRDLWQRVQLSSKGMSPRGTLEFRIADCGLRI